MGRFTSVARAVLWRNVRAGMRNPLLLIPPIIMPLIFFAMFAGGLSGLQNAPGFTYPSGYTTFQFVFIVVQAAAFNGVFLGFYIARDFEGGFANRLLLAAPNRSGILAGYVLSAMARAAAALVILFSVGVLTGVNLDGNVLEITGLVAMALTVCVLGSLWGAGVAMRLKTVQSAPLMQVPVFLGLFLAPVFVPTELLAGWIKSAAELNPFTVFMEVGRSYISGTDAETLLLTAVLGAMFAVLVVWGITGLRRAERTT